MMQKRIAAACALVAGFGLAAGAQADDQSRGAQVCDKPESEVKTTDVEIFDVQLGDKLNLPECRLGEDGKYVDSDNELLSSGACFMRMDEHVNSDSQVCNERVLLTAPKEYTKYITLEAMPLPMAHLEDGRIKEIDYTTRGTENQQAVMARLTRMFGKPDNKRPKSFTSLSGEKLKSFVATWHKDNLHVKFSPTYQSEHFGGVGIATDKGYQDRKKQREANEADN